MSNTNSRSPNSKRSLFPNDGEVDLSANAKKIVSDGGCDSGEKYSYHHDEWFSIQVPVDVNKDKEAAPIPPQQNIRMHMSLMHLHLLVSPLK
eukprot:15001721-Ditylum_brightwellii.AAC.1